MEGTRLNIDLSTMNTYGPSSPLIGTTLENLYQKPLATLQTTPTASTAFAAATGQERNINVYNCQVRDVGLEQKAPTNAEWSNVSGTITANRSTGVSVKEGYQFRTFTESGASQELEVNTVKANDTIYVWADGSISMIGCQPQSITIHNCYDSSLNLQLSTDGKTWQNFTVNGQPVVIYSQGQMAVDIPGGIYIRLTNNSIVSSVYKVPVDPNGASRFPPQVFFRTDGTISTSTCQSGMSEVVIHNCFNVPVSVEVRDNSNFRTVANVQANSFSAALKVKEGSQIRLVNNNQNIQSGTFTVTSTGEIVIYFRIDGTISHTSCTSDISVNAFNCGSADLQVQVRGQEGQDWTTVSGVAVANESNKLRFDSGSQMRLVAADGSFTSQTVDIPQDQNDAPDTIHFQKNGQVSLIGCEVGQPPLNGVPPPIGMVTINNCYSINMIVQRLVSGQWQNIGQNGQQVTVAARGNINLPASSGMSLRLISIDGQTISGVTNLSTPLPPQIFFRSDGHVSNNSCNLPRSTVHNCYDFHMTLQQQVNNVWKNFCPEVTLCGKNMVNVVLTVGQNIRLRNDSKDVTSGVFTVPSLEGGSTVFFRTDGTVNTESCGATEPGFFERLWWLFVIIVAIIIIIILIIAIFGGRGGEKVEKHIVTGPVSPMAPMGVPPAPFYTTSMVIPAGAGATVPGGVPSTEGLVGVQPGVVQPLP